MVRHRFRIIPPSDSQPDGSRNDRGKGPTEQSYSVGYGKPPRHTRFRPGQSGNPKGRPKGTRNLRTDLEEELSRRVPVTEGGRQKNVSLQQLMVKNLVRKAARGETRSEKLLIELIFRTGLNELTESQTSEISASDKAILDRFLEDQLKRLSTYRGRSNGK